LEAQVVPKIHFADSPMPGVSFAAFNAAQFPVFNPIFIRSTEHARVQSASFVVSNQTDRAIIGIALLWKITDASGGWSPYTLRTHSFLSTTPLPVVLPKGVLLVTPGSFFPEAAMLQSGGIIGSAPSEKIINQFNGATDINIQVDCIIFADGEVVGPDQLHLPADIQARKAGADAIVKEVHAAQSKGQDPTTVLRQLRARANSADDRVAKHVSQFAGQLLSTQHFAETLKFVESIKNAPIFFKKDGHSAPATEC
jgi:hypothetical protein